jgi:hypothetical protein
MVAILALAGCGARGALEAGHGAGGGGTGDGGFGGGSPVELGRIQSGCAPADGPAIVMSIDGTYGCTNPPLPYDGVQFLIWGPDLGALEAGTQQTLMIGSGVNSPTQGTHIVMVGSSSSDIPAVSGSLTFTTFVSGQSATGSYEVSFQDGTTGKGAFSALWCPGQTPCG